MFNIGSFLSGFGSGLFVSGLIQILFTDIWLINSKITSYRWFYCISGMFIILIDLTLHSKLQ